MVKKKRARRSKVPKPSSRKSSRPKYKKSNNTWVFVFLGVAVLFSILFNVSQMNLTGNAITGYQTQGGGVMPGQPAGAAQTGTTVKPAETTWQILLNSDNPFVNILQWIFGVPVMLTNTVSSIIIIIAIWLLMFFTMADIIGTFSTFSKFISWIIGFLIAVIAANIGIVTKIALVATTAFAAIAVVGVYIGLAAAVVVFILVNLGITKLQKWMLKRKALMYAMTAESGGKKIAGGVKGFSEITKELKNFGKP